jgi:type VI secretion system secreted protein VgrG
MPTYTQDGRPLRLETPLGKDVLLITGFRGTEAISRPYNFQLDMISEKQDIAATDLVLKPVALTVELRDGSERLIHGRISRFVQLGVRDDLAFYRAEMVPWLWFLSLSRDCRIFQEMTAVEIIEKIFKDEGFTDYAVRCTGSFPKREYCVQYRESDLNFVSRLMQEEGIFYYFEHEKSKHTLVLANSNNTPKPYPGNASAKMGSSARREEDVVSDVAWENAAFVGKVTLNDYDPLQPSLTLKSELSGDGTGEIYDYQPVVYTKKGDGDRYARILLEAEEASREVLRGRGTCRYFQSGSKFTLEEHFRADVNKEYLLLEVSHEVTTGDYRSWDEVNFDYSVRFQAIPAATAYRPPLTAPRPIMRGAQTALVVGKSGEEIWTDKHGRVKVQFYWDRQGKKDENSSCWIRVSSAWAGKAWGAVHLPRMGQEVIVDFLEGDPDRPIITGRVYNAEQTPPYDLPANQTQSGIKSRSSKKGGTSNFNEIRMEDKKDSELLFIQAEKDKEVNVKNDRTETVGNDEKITIKGNRTEEVGKDEKITIKGGRTEKVTKDEGIQVDGKRTRKVGTSEKIKIGTERQVKVGTSDKLKAGTSITIEAGTEITLKVGGNSIKIDLTGITIKGTMVKIEGQAMAEMKSPMTKVEGSGMLQAKAGGMGQVDGGGMLMLKGGITMIN